MTQDPRVKRPAPERTDPVRSWSSLLGATRAADDTNSHAPFTTQPDARDRAPADAGVNEGVRAGYRVIEEYIRQGQESARNAWLGSGLFAPGAREAELTAMTGQMLRYAAEMATMWTGMFNQVARQTPLGGPEAGPRPSIGGFDLGGAQRESESVEVTGGHAPPPAASSQPSAAGVQRAAEAAAVWLSIESTRRIEVCARIEPRDAAGELRAHDLRAIDEHAPRIGAVRIERLPRGELRVVLRVPDELPVGLYSGLVVDDTTNLPAGSLSVRVLP